MKKSLLAGFLMLFIYTGPAHHDLPSGGSRSPGKAGGGPPTIQQLWNVREHLVYKIRYGFFTVAWLTVDLLPDTTYRGTSYHFLRAIIKSNPSIPFVGNKEEKFYSLIAKNDTVPYEVLYWNDDVDDHIHFATLYKLRYDEGKVYSFKREKRGGPLIAGDTLPLHQPSICGPSLFYYLRIYAGTKENETIPIYINQKRDSIRVKNSDSIDKMQIDYFGDDPVSVYKCKAYTGFDGPFGFHGDFTVWFTADSLRVPVGGNARVWLGNVKVRLESYSISPHN